MTRAAHPDHRPTPVLRVCDGAPWPTEDELDLDAEWMASRESGDREWRVDAASPTPGSSPCVGWSPSSGVSPSSATGRAAPLSASRSDEFGDSGAWDLDDVARALDGADIGAAGLDARLGHLEGVVRDR